MDTITSPVSPKFQRGSSFVVGNVFVFVNPLSATPLFSPSSLARAALFGLVVFMPRGRTVAPAPDSPQGACQAMHHRDFPLVDTVMDSRGCAFHLLLSPCQPGLVSNGKSHLGHGSFRHGAQRVEDNLRVVWRGSQRVNLSVCFCMYVCMYACDFKMWWNCGWRWDNKAIPFNVFVCCVS